MGQTIKVPIPNTKLAWVFSTELIDNKKVAVLKGDTLFILKNNLTHFKDLQEQVNIQRVVEYQNEKIIFSVALKDYSLQYYKRSTTKGKVYYEN